MSLYYLNLKSIQLTNPDGAVPIVIVDANFRRNNEASKKLYTLFSFPKSVVWDTYVNLPKGRTIQPGETVELVRLSADGLKTNSGLSESDALAVMSQWQEQKSGIMIDIRYRSGHLMSERRPFKITLK